MKTKNKIIAVIIPVSLLAAAAVAYYMPNVTPEYLINRTIKYQYQIQNKTNKFIKQSEFWAYAPVPKTSNQLVDTIDSSHPYKSEYDTLGNHIQTFEIKDLAPYATKIITLTINLKMSDKANKLPLPKNSKYLLTEKNIESDNKKLRLFSSNLINESSKNKPDTLFNWVSTNIKYEGYIKDDRGALYALNKRSGDCTEYSYLFTALSRSQQMPSRVMGGYVYKEDKRLKPEDFHNWSEYYQNGKWIIADTQNKKHNTNVDSYIAFRIVSDDSNKKLGNSHRFAFSNKDIVVLLQ